MSKSRSFISILIPGATVFISSFCIMVLELVAGRLIARHLGSSLYTWTAVIGVVLAGITIGNYLGGRIADRFNARKTLAVLFAISSAACVVVVILNNLVGDWIFLWKLSWPLRVFIHVSLVFLLPSMLLGTISPVVAKMALDRGLPTGRTVGNIYACGAAGSIAGTFVAGYYLIAAMGTIAIIWSIGGALLLMAIIYWARLWILYLWAAIFLALVTMGIAPFNWAEKAGSSVALRKQPDKGILYEDESQYCYIAVRQLSTKPDKREFLQDKLMHSQIVMDNIDDLQYFYTKIYAGFTHALSRNKDKLSALIIGGGGYVYPRYIENHWPGSRIDVAEIDPGVTEAAVQAFGLDRNTSINSIPMDARNYVDGLLEQERTGGEKTRYDFIYEDAINDYSVPFQLVTYEFNEKISRILAPDGVYLLNVIDIFNIGHFLGAIVNTIEQTFPNVYVLSENAPRDIRNTFVVAASNTQINLLKLIQEYGKGAEIWTLNDTEISALKLKAKGIVLTDDYVPVENMLSPVVYRSSFELLSGRYRKKAQELKQNGRLDESFAMYEKLIETDQSMSVLAYNEMAMIMAVQGKLDESAELLSKAVKYNEQAEFTINIATIYFNLASILAKLGRNEESQQYFHKAIDGFQAELTKKPDSLETVIRLANALMEIQDFDRAIEYFQKAVDLNPYDVENHLILARALTVLQRYDAAIETLKKAIDFMTSTGQKDNAAKLQQYLDFVEFKQSKGQR
jgi:tetratricopeptide (TPR) repeat protein